MEYGEQRRFGFPFLLPKFNPEQQKPPPPARILPDTPGNVTARPFVSVEKDRILS